MPVINRSVERRALLGLFNVGVKQFLHYHGNGTSGESEIYGDECQMENGKSSV